MSSPMRSYRPDSIKVRCEGCVYQDLCIYRRVVQEAVRAVSGDLMPDDWSAGDEPVITGIDITNCSRYNAKK